MPEVRMDAVALVSNDGVSQTGQLKTLVFSSGERMGQAVKVLVICWVLAAITLFIPIAHFFLVPLFLIAGPVMAVIKYKVESAPENVEGICPECRESVKIVLDPADKLPKHSYCPKCNKPVQLVYDNASNLTQ